MSNRDELATAYMNEVYGAKNWLDGLEIFNAGWDARDKELIEREDVLMIHHNQCIDNWEKEVKRLKALLKEWYDDDYDGADLLIRTGEELALKVGDQE